ncbi:MAG: flagellar protein [Eubacterium sp.]|nr:flagellar protein [Eubacterium sp.]
MAKINTGFSSIEQVRGEYLKENPKRVDNNIEGFSSFEEILKSVEERNEAQELKFSRHASQRLSDRSIDLSEEQVDRLNTGATMAKEKGINNSLIMVDSLAFIVNTPNSTVVTALDSTESNSNVFTNIDGAVVI